MHQEKDESFNYEWNKNLITISTYVFLTSFVLELIILIITIFTDAMSMSVLQHLGYKIALPSLLSLIVIWIMKRALESSDNRWLGKNRNAIVCYCFFLICAIISVVHNYYHVVWVLPGVCQFVASIYADKKMIKHIFDSSWFVLALTFVFAMIEGLYPFSYLIVAFICSVAFNFVMYIVANLLLGYHKEQTDYINYNYYRYKHLVMELSTDSMTGLFNKKTLVENIESYIESEKENLCLCVAMVDFDHFKNINDTYGHMRGDQVIYRFVKMVNALKNTGIVGYRYGGEEFCLLLKDKNMEDLKAMLDDFREKFAKEVYSFDMNMRVTISIGITSYCAGDSANELINRADSALYQAKEQGRNRIVVL